MARIFTEGFEMGDALGFDFLYDVGVNTTQKRSGNYSGDFSKWHANAYKNISDSNEIYLRSAFRVENNTRARFGLHFNNGETNLVKLEQEASDLKRFLVYIGSSYIATTEAFLPSTWHLLEVHVKISDVDGSIIIKNNGIEVYSYNGDTKPGTDTTINRIYFKDVDYGIVNVDDIAINDTSGLEDNSWCGDGHVIAIKPNADGDSSQLTNSAGTSIANYSYVDDIPSDGDTTYVWGNTIDNQDLYNLTAPSLPVNHKIKRIYVEARAKDPDVGDIALPIKAGTTQSDGTTKGLTTAYSAIKGDEYTTNPDTGVEWTESDLNALQAGVKIKS